MRSEKVTDHSNIERLYAPVDYRDLPRTYNSLIEAAGGISLKFTEPGSSSRIPELVISDNKIAWNHLELLKSLVPPRIHSNNIRFIEWGSGLGVVSQMASRLGWDVIGIDIEPTLVRAATELAEQFESTARFHLASYKPDGFDSGKLDKTRLLTDAGFGLFDFDVIYGFFWPAEVNGIRTFFLNNAKPSTLFMLYKGGIQFELYRCKQ